MRLRQLLLGGILVVLAACTALSENTANNLVKQYMQNTRSLGLIPVYPPSEEFQVGDIYFVSYSTNDIDKTKETAAVYLGTLRTLRQAANEYLASRINYDDSVAESNNKPSGIQSDFSGGVVAVNNGSRRSLPLVTYPAIKGSASSAAALGGFGFGSSFGLGFGQSETVTVNFNDTRIYGLPLGAFTLDLNAFGTEYTKEICTAPIRAINRAFLILKGRQIIEEKEEMCRNGRACEIRAITRTIRTRKISYTYSSARIANLAATRARNVPDDPQSTQALPPQVSLDVTIGEKTSEEQLQALVSALNTSTSGTPPATPSSSLRFVGFQGNSLQFERPLLKPVAVAYEALTYNLDGDAPSCLLYLDPETGVITKR